MKTVQESVVNVWSESTSNNNIISAWEQICRRVPAVCDTLKLLKLSGMHEDNSFFLGNTGTESTPAHMGQIPWHTLRCSLMLERRFTICFLAACVCTEMFSNVTEINWSIQDLQHRNGRPAWFPCDYKTLPAVRRARKGRVYKKKYSTFNKGMINASCLWATYIINHLIYIISNSGGL